MLGRVKLDKEAFEDLKTLDVKQRQTAFRVP